MSALIIIFFVSLCAFGNMISIEIRPLIWGGNRATIEEAPFMAIYMMDAPSTLGSCGASILSERFVLSAAHCYDEPDHRYYVVVGTDTFGGGRQLNIENNIIHPYYNYRNLDYDILVIKLSGKLQFGAKIQPIQMADSKLVIREGAILNTFGFGFYENGFVSKYLRKVRVPYIHQGKCQSVYDHKLTDRMICAGKNGKDSCEGDSGGPLVYNNVLVGVVSHGVECGLYDSPGVYASVSRVRKFIDDVIKNM